MRFLRLAAFFWLMMLATHLRADQDAQAVLRAGRELPRSIWRRYVRVQTPDGRSAPYLIFNLHGTYFSYTPKEGSRRIWPSNHTANGFAMAVAGNAYVNGIFTGDEDYLGAPRAGR